MIQNENSTLGKHTISALLLGSVGGVALVVIVNATTNGPAIFLPYTLLILAAIFKARQNRIPTFGSRFLPGVDAFMSATIILYTYLAMAVNPDGIGLWTSQFSVPRYIWEHVWRLGLMLLIGIPVSAIAAQLSAPKRENPTATKP